MIGAMRRAFLIFTTWLLVIGHLSAALSLRGSCPPTAVTVRPNSTEYGVPTPKNEVVGLYYLRARYLNASNGRFWNADKYEGQNSEPQSLHKYLYANADPVMGVDPSGYLSISETMVSTAIKSGLVSMAIMAPFRAYRFSQEIVDGHTLAQASANAALGLTQDFAIGAVSGAVFQWIPGIIRAAKVGEAFTRATNSVWNLGAFARGRAIEQMVLGRIPTIKGVAQTSFPVIDDFWNGIATSIKSVDVRAASYQSVSALKSLLRGYVDDLAAFQGARQGARVVARDEIGERLLLVAIEEGAATAQQIRALNQFAIEAGGKGVRLVFQWIP